MRQSIRSVPDVFLRWIEKEKSHRKQSLFGLFFIFIEFILETLAFIFISFMCYIDTNEDIYDAIIETNS